MGPGIDEPRLVLSSASPRRRRILAALGVLFDTVDVEVDEQPLPKESPETLAQRLAIRKAEAGAARHPGSVALGADTVVAVRRKSLGKPKRPEDAEAMLRRLRGRLHRVITAVAAARTLPDSSGRLTVASRVATAVVRMRSYTDEEIRAYVASGDPFDKAGAYAIQDPVFHPVEEAEGCFLTVVGLPLPETREVLAELGLQTPPIARRALLEVCPGCADEASLLSLLSS